ncbi:hypothetical protein [Lysobacter panacisoli]|uniref:Uncharacterized protein n=1 Tax=Lysobacter panacisoli TaxID=1255263 RepID=A0ABP9LPT5_9GAMM|nr:hypothetical protein [Lysobacter panacisoli]
MQKSRNELASDLFAMRASMPLWRKSLSEDELMSVYHDQAHRVLSWAGEEDRQWVTTQLNALVPSKALVRPG